MKTTRILTFILVLAAFGVFVAHAQGVKQETTNAPAQTAQAAKQEEHDHGVMKEKRFVATVGTDGVQHVEITGGSYYFDPNYIVVKVNTPVEFMVKKESGFVPHDIIVKAPEAGIDFSVELKEKPAPITFTPTKVGKYEMYCDKKLLFFKSHKDRGMDGMIEVVP